uniref:Putative coat protein n=1 Tax=Sclerotium hydrophilum virus 2 TaxID=1895001 RepID=A0A286K5I8_9VIRU|nr:putative coat protein [Sclerotium hydrophilum virus 2]
MSGNANTQVQPVSDGAAGHAPAPASVPQRRPLRRQNATNLGPVPRPPVTYTKGTGVSSLLADMDAYNASKVYNNLNSEYIPSFLALKGAIYLATQRLANHDRLLKDTGRTHPLMDEAYLSFVFIYHIIRCRRDILQWSPELSTLLSDLEATYPPNRIHVPGYAVPFLMSITTTESPYDWQAFICPRLPDTSEATGANLFRPGNGVCAIFPSPIVVLDQILRFTSQRRDTPNITSFEPYTRTFGSDVNDNTSFGRWITSTVHYRLPHSSSPRLDHQFYWNVAVDPASQAPGNNNYNFAIFDIPTRYTRDAAHTRAPSWAEYMGIQQYNPANVANTRYLNWPLQYSSEVAFQCQYIHGSRTLADISTTGLGASSVIMRYLPNLIPAPEIDPNSEARRAAQRITNLPANGTSRDPNLEQIAVQHAALCQVNVSFNGFVVLSDAVLRRGPYWEMAECERLPQFDAAMYMFTNLSQTISSVRI